MFQALRLDKITEVNADREEEQGVKSGALQDQGFREGVQGKKLLNVIKVELIDRERVVG